jgi:hypothetical protein
MCSLSATSLVIAITAQRLHSKVRDFGSGKNFDLDVGDVDMHCSQTGQRGTIIVGCSVITESLRVNTPPPNVGVGGGAKPAGRSGYT